MKQAPAGYCICEKQHRAGSNQNRASTTWWNSPGKGGFIRVPGGAEYNAEDVINVVLHAATSSSNSIESAVQDLQAMHPISRIPCADTVHTVHTQYRVDFPHLL